MHKLVHGKCRSSCSVGDWSRSGPPAAPRSSCEPFGRPAHTAVPSAALAAEGSARRCTWVRDSIDEPWPDRAARGMLDDIDKPWPDGAARGVRDDIDKLLPDGLRVEARDGIEELWPDRLRVEAMVLAPSSSRLQRDQCVGANTQSSAEPTPTEGASGEVTGDAESSPLEPPTTNIDVEVTGDDGLPLPAISPP